MRIVESGNVHKYHTAIACGMGDDVMVNIAGAGIESMADGGNLIPNSSIYELPSIDYLQMVGDTDALPCFCQRRFDPERC